MDLEAYLSNWGIFFYPNMANVICGQNQEFFFNPPDRHMKYSLVWLFIWRAPNMTNCNMYKHNVEVQNDFNFGHGKVKVSSTEWHAICVTWPYEDLTLIYSFQFEIRSWYFYKFLFRSQFGVIILVSANRLIGDLWLLSCRTLDEKYYQRYQAQISFLNQNWMLPPKVFMKKELISATLFHLFDVAEVPIGDSPSLNSGARLDTDNCPSVANQQVFMKMKRCI